MIITTFRRIVRTGFVNFWRNGFLSFAAVVVITLSLLSFGALIFGVAFGRTLITDVKNQVDVNVYFSMSAAEADILALQKEVNALPEVASTSYISPDEAMTQFQDRWKSNTLIMQGLQEIGDNPFPAVLNIKANDPGQYGNIVSFLDNKSPTDSSGAPVIDHINYEQNKLIIDRLSRIIPTVEQAGGAIALVLIIVAIIVVWNTIRLIIYTARDEISIMKLVGASNAYVRGPFVISGVMYGAVSAAIALVLLGAFANWSDTVILKLAGIDVASNFSLVVNILSTYFMENIGEISTLMFAAGIILGGVSSYIAAKRYLKV